MRTLLVDDEELARARLNELLVAHPEVVVVAEAENGLQALELISLVKPDLIFLDIEMPGLTGIELLAHLSVQGEDPLLIFTTGYQQHALAAFEANALAYLLKPIRPERLAGALRRALQLADYPESRQAQTQQIERLLKSLNQQSPKLIGRKKDRVFLLNPSDVCFFSIEDGYVKARTPADSFWLSESINDLEAMLPQEAFFRARRETLVNLNKVHEIRPFFKSTYILVLDDLAATEIIVSERQSKILRQRLPGV